MCVGWGQHGRSGAMGRPLKLGWNRGGVTQEHQKSAVFPKRYEIGPRLLWRTNRKSNTLFWLVPKSVTLDYLERRIQGLPKVFEYPQTISGTGKATDFKFGCYIQCPSVQKPTKNFGDKGAWAYPWTAQSFKVPPVSLGMGKATNFKFCAHFHTIDHNKSPQTILGKVAMGVARDSQKNFRASIYRHLTAILP